MSSVALDPHAAAFPGTLPRNVFADARLLLAGAGNIASYAAASLAEAGCGFLRIVDRDRVELRNTINQLYTSGDIGLPKADALAGHVRSICSRTQVEAIVADLEDAPHGLFADVDLVLGGLDSLHARQILANEQAWPQGIAVIDGAVDGEGEPLGSVEVLLPDDATACLECRWGLEHYRQLAREMPCNPKSGASGPPTGASALQGAAVASLVVREAARLLAGPRPTESYLLEFDLRYGGIVRSRLRRAAGCRFDHTVVRQSISLDVPFETATVGDMLRVLHNAAPSAQLHFRRGIFDDGLFGGSRWLSYEQLVPHAARRLTELGLTQHDRVRVRAGGLDAFLNLAPAA
jgi:molybdopterin/thiamine biosynthesis adenylyltransferase